MERISSYNSESPQRREIRLIYNLVLFHSTTDIFIDYVHQQKPKTTKFILQYTGDINRGNCCMSDIQILPFQSYLIIFKFTTNFIFQTFITLGIQTSVLKVPYKIKMDFRLIRDHLQCSINTLLAQRFKDSFVENQFEINFFL